MSKVAEILEAMAANAGRAQLARGALIGGTIADVSQLPAVIANDRDKAKLEALKTAQVQQQMGLEASRGRREDQLATSAQAQAAKEQQTQQHLSAIIGAGFTDDPSKFDVGAANKKAMDLGRADLIPTVAAVHDKFTKAPTILKEGEQGFDPTTHAPIPGMGVPDKPTILKPGEVGFDSTAHTPIPGLSVPETVKPNTAEQDDAKYREIQARAAQKLPVLPAEQAWSDAYEKQKTLTTDRSAGAATDRQTNAINAESERQRNSQSFSQAEVGRAQLGKKEDAYQEALQKAAVLKNVVELAKSGNVVAGSLQPLVATMATLGAEGFKRLTGTELATTSGAGSAWERLKGKVGKLIEGQPIPADVQADMLTLADALTKGAYDTYKTGFDTITKRYKLTDEEPRSAPSGYVAPKPPALTPGLAGVAGRP